MAESILKTALDLSPQASRERTHKTELKAIAEHVCRRKLVRARWLERKLARTRKGSNGRSVVERELASILASVHALTAEFDLSL